MQLTYSVTAVVIVHAIVVALHGLAHQNIPVPLSMAQSLFVGVVIVLVSIMAAILLWTRFYPIGRWLFFGCMTGALLLGIYNHFIMITPDHISQIPFEGWGVLFQVTAFLLLITEGCGCGVGLQVELADSLSMAFLVVLERLSPIERAVFLLREVFEYDYPEIAQIVGKSAQNCRQILRRSRQHITAQRPRFPVSHQQQEQITRQFLEASTQGNLQDLLTLLAKDVTFWSDGGGRVAAALRPLHGAMKVARFLLAIQRRFLTSAQVQLVEVNGLPGILIGSERDIQGVMTFEIVDSYIQAIYSVRNPEKLERLSQ